MRVTDDQIHVLEKLEAFNGTASYDQIQSAVDVRILRRLRSEVKALRDLHLVLKSATGRYSLTVSGREHLHVRRTQLAA